MNPSLSLLIYLFLRVSQTLMHNCMPAAQRQP
jgi:hypothetical protein